MGLCVIIPVAQVTPHPFFPVLPHASWTRNSWRAFTSSAIMIQEFHALGIVSRVQSGLATHDIS